nr:60S ribosomal protein L3 [Ipomoea batatas]
MTHIVKEVEKPGSKLHKKETCEAVTIIETPTIVVFKIEAHGTKDIEAQLEKMTKYAVLVHTQKVDYAYGFFEKHVPVDDVFQKDEMIDIIGVTRLAPDTFSKFSSHHRQTLAPSVTIAAATVADATIADTTGCAIDQFEQQFSDAIAVDQFGHQFRLRRRAVRPPVQRHHRLPPPSPPSTISPIHPPTDLKP